MARLGIAALVLVIACIFVIWQSLDAASLAEYTKNMDVSDAGWSVVVLILICMLGGKCR